LHTQLPCFAVWAPARQNISCERSSRKTPIQVK
jgi:hypothetical protein